MSLDRNALLSIGVAAAVSAGVAVLAYTGFALGTADSALLLPYEDADALRTGRAVYAENCASCHGDTLEGEADWRGRDEDGYLRAPPHDASGHTWHHPDSLLIDITTRGSAAVIGDGYESRMPGFQDVLSADEITAVLAYIKSTWPVKILEAHNELNQRYSDK